MKWSQMRREDIRKHVFDALAKNVNFYDTEIIGIPGSHLDPKVFYADAPFLEDAPFLSALVHNPNHIGCHTTGKSESFFDGTHAIERDLIELCSVDILNAAPNSCDGYVTSGGTEANIQAAWIYRNYFVEKGANPQSISILCSSDAHYSVYKAANLLGIQIHTVDVEDATRSIDEKALVQVVNGCKHRGINHFIVYVNMMTTMFGSVDDPTKYERVLKTAEVAFKLHADGAYGGFFFPFTDEKQNLDFSNPAIDSVTLDAHKMVQAPYGTGIFLARKGWMKYTRTQQASYVEGEDTTLIGSRSGANAIAVWMILMTYGYLGWKEKVHVLSYRANQLEAALKDKNIRYFRQPSSNIITMRADDIPREVARRFTLVPDNHHQPNWYKVVVMDHVNPEILSALASALPAV
jgi:tyrosine decarboxylase / aspartate 1-decarboxylase